MVPESPKSIGEVVVRCAYTLPSSYPTCVISRNPIPNELEMEQLRLAFCLRATVNECCYLIEPMPATPTKKSATRGGIGNVFNKLTSKIGDPVDFELPDWLSKWQPTPYPYTSIRRNIYLTNKGKRRLEDDGISCACSSTAESSDVCGMDCLCSMLWSSCTSGCKCGSSCLNKPFHQRPVKKMKIVKTEKCGTGIVADEDIKTKEFVVEYVGEVIDDKTCEERLWKLKHSGETNFYLCEINRNMVIDATYKGNKSRYINHSCCPNTEMQRCIFSQQSVISECAFALRLTSLADAAALKLVACQVAAPFPKEKVLLSAKHVCTSALSVNI
ncbi:hypothetical protein KY284_003834 [Solanum tuberosum]|nr:hypothetical protein KY284_003834 [Solanum tuberosum]